MAVWWKGATPEYRAARESDLSTRIVRRLGRLGISLNTSATDARGWQHGRIAEVGRHAPGGVIHHLGTVEGRDPYDVLLKAAHEFSPLDAELIEQHTAYIEMEAERIVFLARQEIKLCDEIDALIGALGLPCPRIVDGKHIDSGLPGGACEECMNTGRVPRV